MVTIKRFSEASKTPTQLEALERIFFETSTRKIFNSEKDRAEFRYRYLDLYLKNPEWVWVALDSKQNVLGYLVVQAHTSDEVFTLVPSLNAFRNSIVSLYPAHLHINITESARGLALGSQMLKHMEEALKSEAVKGVHLVTTSQSRNVSFYQKNGYETVASSEVNGIMLMMLGKRF
jgi:ribosomal protein S18 acetylase RimI-like enzyme